LNLSRSRHLTISNQSTGYFNRSDGNFMILKK